MPMFKIFYIMSLLLLSAPAFAENAFPLDYPGFHPSAERGKKTFDTVCIHCHNATHEVSVVGCPGLEGVLTRHSAVWIDTWLTSPASFAKTNIKAKAVVAANPYGLVMPTLPEMANERERLDIIAYLKTLK